MTRPAAGQSLWVVSSFFNPAGYRRRLQNFRQFSRHLGAPLATAELSSTGEFALSEADSDLLLQVHGPDVLWQKERLLNLAIERLPASCRYVAWIDCDLVFNNAAWVSRVSAALRAHRVVQVFEKLIGLPRDADIENPERAESVFVHDSLVARVRSGDLTIDPFATQGMSIRHHYAPGGGWAARRELIDGHGLYDACIIGSGDKMFAAAAHNRHESVARAVKITSAHAEHYLEWAGPFARAVAEKVGFACNTAYHLWHGAVEDRRYQARLASLVDADFDPYQDIRVDAAGCWRWASNKPALHASVLQYFHSRREDG